MIGVVGQDSDKDDEEDGLRIMRAGKCQRVSETRIG